jgi:hypothetical protein
MPRYWKPDALAHYLSIPYCVREKLKLKTVGSLDVLKTARKELRRREDKLRKRRERRAQGATPQTEALSNTRPWEALGISRRTWERRGKPGLDANSSAVTPTPKT